MQIRSSRLPLLLFLGLLGWGSAAILEPRPAQAQTPVTSILNGGSGTALEVTYSGGLLAPGKFADLSRYSAPDDSILAEGTGTRMMWYPEKAAFRAGSVFDNTGSNGVDGRQFWNAAKVGRYSVALGSNTKSTARSSVAMGDRTTASANSAAAMGDQTTASGFSATAMGFDTKATAQAATATGYQTLASGAYATAMGEDTEASGFAATAMGQLTIASAEEATAMGRETTASGFGATAMGTGTTASGRATTAMGTSTTASGSGATAMGFSTIAATEESLTIGRYNDKNRGNDDPDPSTGPLFVVGNGNNSNLPSSRSDALVLDQSGNLTISGGLNENSDRRLKKKIEPLGSGILQRLSQLRPVRFEFKNEKTHPSAEQIGLVAQDVRKEFPQLVSEGSGGYLSLSYSKLTAVLLKGIQEQQRTIDSLEKRIRRLDQVEKRLAVLEAQRSSALPAGWGPVALLLLLVGGGSFGTGLLWRRRS